MPAASARIGGEELVVGARVAIDHDHVTVPGGPRAALDRHVPGEGVASPVGLAGVVEAHRHPAGATRDDGVGNPVRSTVVHRAEVGMDGVGGADHVDHRRGVVGHRQSIDALVPRVVGGEHRTTRSGQHGRGAGTARVLAGGDRAGHRHGGCARRTGAGFDAPDAPVGHRLGEGGADRFWTNGLSVPFRRRRGSRPGSPETRPAGRSRCSRRRPATGADARPTNAPAAARGPRKGAPAGGG